MLRSASLVLSLALGAAILPAQQQVGFYLQNGNVNASGVLCGFNCGSPTNTVAITANVSASLSFRIIGDTNTIAVLAVALGPAVACPGLVFPGVNNALLLNPANLLTTLAFAPAAPNAARNTCNPSGGLALMLPAPLIVPAVASGLTLTYQGVAMDAGGFAFTRAIQVAVP